MKATLIIKGKEIEIEISEEEYKKLHPYESANYYSSDIIAENNARADKLMRQLRRFAVQHREPGINFNNVNTAKFYIICDYENDELRSNYISFTKVFGAIYFDSREVANAAIDKFHDELIWYFNEYKGSL